MLQNTLLWWESLSRVKLGQTADLLKCMRSLGGIKHDSCQPTYCSLSLWKLTASMEEIGQACFLSVINLPKLARLTPGAAPERRQLSERWHDKHIELSAAHPRCHAWPTSPPSPLIAIPSLKLYCFAQRMSQCSTTAADPTRCNGNQSLLWKKWSVYIM